MRLSCYLKKTISFTVVLLFIFINIYSQENVYAKYPGIENELLNNVVTSIFQDHNGFMWFGTYDGLKRYNGYEFRVFRNVIGDSNLVN